MALKDLVAEKSVLREGAIEEIVSDYVRFHPAEKAISFTPATDGLSNRGKVLVYLVALQGWPFVSEDKISVEAKPADIEQNVGIPGGTLRPILKELKDRHIIAEKGGRYFVRDASMTSIKAEIGSKNSSTQPSTARARTRRGRSNKPAAGAKAQKAEAEANGASGASKRFQRRKSTNNMGERFQKWMDEGFFDTAKTLADVKDRFHKAGLIVPASSIPVYLLRALRSEKLEREKESRDGKDVWVYRTSGRKK
jgi:hypothetical protein